MTTKVHGKRSAPTSQTPSKKRKLTRGGAEKNLVNRKKKPQINGAKKEKLADSGFIPIPIHDDGEEVDLSDEDMGMLDEFGGSVAFLDHLDRKGIMRSKKETQRLYEAGKPVRQAREDSLPSIDSHDEDEESWSSGIDNLSGEDGGDSDEDYPQSNEEDHDDPDIEMSYELAPRKVETAQDSEKNKQVQRLPIKLANGRVQSSGTKTVNTKKNEEPEEDIDSSEDEEEVEPTPIEDVSTGARFGRPAVAAVLQTKSRTKRIDLAKQQIAGICQDILGDPENSLGLLKRLHSFALKEVVTPTQLDPVPNDTIIRKLAVLSQLAVFKDILPGYRIRALTEKEKGEKVSQMVARTRDWEQGLVSIYQNYLRLLEQDLKERSELADVAIHCMCILLTEVTHFNFRTNLMVCIVTRLSKKSWDKTSDLCLNALNNVFRADLTGVHSLEVVRVMNRMIKEKRFKVHPKVLSCLLNLRLRTELGVRSSQTTADRADANDQKPQRGKGKQKKEKQHLSKSAKKALKEKKEIEKEMREAEAEVDKEDRAITQTETLKLLFALYFRILKNPTRSPLLPAALAGISTFAHLVNIDFFKDLMQVLKDLINLDSVDTDDSESESIAAPFGDFKSVSHRLLCINTAFELLSGQGEALNIDLSDFISQLFAMILPLSLMHDIDTQCPGSPSSKKSEGSTPVADLLFRALNMVFSPRTSGATGPPWRAAAFAKRLLGASLHWPPSAALRVLEFVKALIAKNPKLEALLSTEDRIFNGIYRPDVDDPQLCHPFETSFWELHVLHEVHWDPRVREEAKKLLTRASSS